MNKFLGILLSLFSFSVFASSLDFSVSIEVISGVSVTNTSSKLDYSEYVIAEQSASNINVSASYADNSNEQLTVSTNKSGKVNLSTLRVRKGIKSLTITNY